MKGAVQHCIWHTYKLRRSLLVLRQDVVQLRPISGVAPAPRGAVGQAEPAAEQHCTAQVEVTPGALLLQLWPPDTEEVCVNSSWPALVVTKFSLLVAGQ